MISSCPPYYSSAASCLLRSHHVLLFRIGGIWLSFLFGQAWSLCPSLLLSRSLFLHAARILSSSSVLLFRIADHENASRIILLAFCLLFSATRQLLSDVEKLGCGCHTRAPKPISVSRVCRGAEARILWYYILRIFAIRKSQNYVPAKISTSTSGTRVYTITNCVMFSTLEHT